MLDTQIMTKTLVWATRPSHQNSAWQQQLARLDADILTIPLLAIVPVMGEQDRQAIKKNVLDLDHFEHVIFVSQNAVAHAFKWFEDYWPQLPVGVNFYAVGAKTAAAVRSYGITVTECGEAMNSEAILALPALRDVSGQKVLICRGKGGRPKLAVALTERGAQVRYCELYERQLPVTAHEQSLLIPAATKHVIPLFSGDTLVNLMCVLPATINRNSIVLVLPAERVAEQARQLGFHDIRIAKNASEAAMLESIKLALLSQ